MATKNITFLVGLAVVVLALFGCGNRVVQSQQLIFQVGEIVERPVPLPSDVLSALQRDEDVQACLARGWISGPVAADWFAVSEIHLNNDAEADLVVTTVKECLFGANIAPFWVFLKTKEGYREVLGILALRLEVLNTATHGCRDIKTSSVVGSAVAVTTKLKFDGSTYRLASRRDKVIGK